MFCSARLKNTTARSHHELAANITPSDSIIPDVARVKARKAETRGNPCRFPDSAALHPGYRFVQHLCKAQ